MIKYCHTCWWQNISAECSLYSCTFLARGRRISPSAHNFLLQDLQKNNEKNNSLRKLLADSAFFGLYICNISHETLRSLFSDLRLDPRGVGQVTIALTYFSITKSHRPSRLSSLPCLIFNFSWTWKQSFSPGNSQRKETSVVAGKILWSQSSACCGGVMLKNLNFGDFTWRLGPSFRESSCIQISGGPHNLFLWRSVNL